MATQKITPNSKRNTLVRCYFGMNSIKVARALGFNRTLVSRVERAYNLYTSVPDAYVALVSGPFGTFWYGGIDGGYFFEITHANLNKAVRSLESVIASLRRVNKKVPLSINIQGGQRHSREDVEQAAQYLKELFLRQDPTPSKVWVNGTIL